VNILILGDRKPLNDSDLAFATLADAGQVTFLYRGAPYPLPFGIAADEANIVSQIKRIVAEKRIDVIYFRVDWFDKLYQAHGREIFDTHFGVPMVFGYHCHTCHRTPLEAFAIENADALVLLNEESQTWIESLHGIAKPTLLVPSLLLPKRAWYDVPLRSKLSATDGLSHVVIPSNAIRTASIPEKLDANVPLENYVLDRYDYLRLCEQLLRRGVAVHIYGKFQVQGGSDGSAAEATYRALADRFSGRLHFPGRVDQRDFATELSQYDAALLTGFVPYQPVPKFDHMNYQVRFNPVLAARLPSFIPAGTTSCGEREIEQTGAGFVFDSIDGLVDTLHDDGALAKASNAAHSAQDRHSAEAWTSMLVDFFAKAVRRNRSSSKAA
jgi:hypothetical protein